MTVPSSLAKRMPPHECVMLCAPRYAGDSVEKGNLVKIRDCPAAVIGNENCIMALTEDRLGSRSQ